MPSAEVHRLQAGHNAAAAAAFIRGPFSDWAVTALFYSALHEVDAYFAARFDVHPGTHAARERAMRRDSELAGVEHNFRELQSASTDARYEGSRFTPADVAELGRLHLAPIQVLVARLLR